MAETPTKTPKGQLIITQGQCAEKVRATVCSRFHKTPLAEYLTNDSKSYCSLTKQQQRDALVTREPHILDEDSNDTILENMGCIYKFTYPNLKTQETVEQIAVGIVVKVHGTLSVQMN